MAEDLEEDFDDSDMSDEMDAAPSRHGGGGGGGGNKKFILILVPLLLVIAAIAGAYFTGILDPIFHKKKEAPVEAVTTQPQEAQAPVFDDLPELLVNLNSSGRKQNFLKIRVKLELDSPLDLPKIDAVMPRIVDTFQVYLRELRLEDLQGSAGLLRLREELLNRVNNTVKPVKVNDVLFVEMLVQ